MLKILIPTWLLKKKLNSCLSYELVPKNTMLYYHQFSNSKHIILCHHIAFKVVFHYHVTFRVVVKVFDKLNTLFANPFRRPDFISPLDDLAFDMYQDPEVAGIIRKLEKKKQEAVLRKLSLYLNFNFQTKLGSYIPQVMFFYPSRNVKPIFHCNEKPLTLDLALV